MHSLQQEQFPSDGRHWHSSCTATHKKHKTLFISSPAQRPGVDQSNKRLNTNQTWPRWLEGFYFSFSPGTEFWHGPHVHSVSVRHTATSGPSGIIVGGKWLSSTLLVAESDKLGSVSDSKAKFLGWDHQKFPVLPHRPPTRHRRGSTFLQVKVTSAGEARGEAREEQGGGRRKHLGNRTRLQPSNSTLFLLPPQFLSLLRTHVSAFVSLSDFLFYLHLLPRKQTEMRKDSPVTRR